MRASAPAFKAIGYRYLLALIILAYAVIIAIPVQLVRAPVRIIVLSLLLQMTLRTRRRAVRFARPAWILSGVLFAVALIAAVTSTAKVLEAITELSTIILVGVAIFVLGETLRTSKIVDFSVVQGVLSVYLLVALLFAAIHEFGATFTAHYLHGADPATASDTLYFSLITITTVGYGDISPGNHLAQAVAACEALVGQLYLVSVVAVVVSRYQWRDEDGGAAGDPPPSPEAAE